MDWIWEKTFEFWCSYFGDHEDNGFGEDSAPAPTSSPELQSSKTKSRVRFSSSTIRNFQLHELEQLGSTNAFFNFLLAQRIREVGLVGLNYLDVVNANRLISEKHIWDSMDEMKREPYLKLAKSIRQRHMGTFQDKRKREETGYQIRRRIIYSDQKRVKSPENSAKN